MYTTFVRFYRGIFYWFGLTARLIHRKGDSFHFILFSTGVFLSNLKNVVHFYKLVIIKKSITLFQELSYTQ